MPVCPVNAVAGISLARLVGQLTLCIDRESQPVSRMYIMHCPYSGRCAPLVRSGSRISRRHDYEEGEGRTRKGLVKRHMRVERYKAVSLLRSIYILETAGCLQEGRDHADASLSSSLVLSLLVIRKFIAFKRNRWCHDSSHTSVSHKDPLPSDLTLHRHSLVNLSLDAGYYHFRPYPMTLEEQEVRLADDEARKVMTDVAAAAEAREAQEL